MPPTPSSMEISTHTSPAAMSFCSDSPRRVPSALSSTSRSPGICRTSVGERRGVHRLHPQQRVHHPLVFHDESQLHDEPVLGRQLEQPREGRVVQPVAVVVRVQADARACDAPRRNGEVLLPAGQLGIDRAEGSSSPRPCRRQSSASRALTAPRSLCSSPSKLPAQAWVTPRERSLATRRRGSSHGNRRSGQRPRLTFTSTRPVGFPVRPRGLPAHSAATARCAAVAERRTLEELAPATRAIRPCHGWSGVHSLTPFSLQDRSQQPLEVVAQDQPLGASPGCPRPRTLASCEAKLRPPASLP